MLEFIYVQKSDDLIEVLIFLELEAPHPCQQLMSWQAVPKSNGFPSCTDIYIYNIYIVFQTHPITSFNIDLASLTNFRSFKLL